MDDRQGAALKALSDAVLAIASRLSVDDVLQRLVDRSRELASARYAAIGIPDGDGGFRRFIVSGMSDELIAAMGPLPRTHGMLAAVLESRGSYRTADIHHDPRFRGWWPQGHPDMRSFLGVPIVAGEQVIGAFYLTEKQGEPGFSTSDQELIELLAAHAAIAITNARLYEQSRELSVVSERNRLAFELHDVVSQKLFGVVLAAEAAATQLDRDPDAARAQLLRVRELARQTLDELRALILGLRPPDLERDGLVGALRKELDMLGRVHGVTVELVDQGGSHASPRLADELSVLRIVQEAVHNALRHARADAVRVTIHDHVFEVADDGVGFDPDRPALRARHLGLTSMEQRAAELGGRLVIDTAPGSGTTVRLELPSDG